MCGIFAIFSSNNNQNIGNQLLNGLKLLQHRGKDGYGIAYYMKNHFHAFKKKGTIKMNHLDIDSRCCIGHNRYSTSGYTINNGTIKKNPVTKPVDINQLPAITDLGLFDEQRFYRPLGGKIRRVLPVETHRGCPYTCSFCNSPSQNRLYSGNGSFFRKKVLN